MPDLPAWIAAIIAAVIPSFGEETVPAYAGYVEADYIYVSPAVTRRIDRMEVREGDVVTPGQFLFAMELTRETAALHAAVARRDVAEANLHNLETGSRDEEIRVIKASLEQALAEQDLARTNLARSQSLFEREIVTTARVDADRAALERANALVSQLRAQLDVAELPARDAQRLAAQAGLDAAVAEVELAQSALDDLSVTAPVAGLVESLYFEAGEVAAAGTPVMAILPPGALSVLFYIPEPARTGFAPGMALALECDGCPEDARATLTRIGSEPQFTPPIIFSREERARLVFRAEARIEGDLALMPGQPVSLTLLP